MKICHFENSWGILVGVDTMKHGWEPSEMSGSIPACFGIDLETLIKYKYPLSAIKFSKIPYETKNVIFQQGSKCSDNTWLIPSLRGSSFPLSRGGYFFFFLNVASDGWWVLPPRPQVNIIHVFITLHRFVFPNVILIYEFLHQIRLDTSENLKLWVKRNRFSL